MGFGVKFEMTEGSRWGKGRELFHRGSLSWCPVGGFPAPETRLSLPFGVPPFSGSVSTCSAP